MTSRTRDGVDVILRTAMNQFFEHHSEGLSVEEASALVGEIDEYLVTIRGALEQNEFLDVGLAERIAEACKGLLSLYSGLDNNGRAAVVGAVRYFIDQHDADDDLTSVVGFEDDAEVVNFVIALTRADVPLVNLED